MNKQNKKIIIAFFSLIVLIVTINFISAAASFSITAFSCSPSETAINSVFSCSATVKNNGDASGTLNTATLYPSSSWLESSNYAQAYGQSITAGQSVSITFTGLRATRSGNNGFSKIMLDSVEDTYVADQNKKVNVVDVVVSVTNSASSANRGGSWTSEASVIVGGNVNIVLGFAVNSGGCTINGQEASETWNGMSDGSSQSKTWTVTQGTGDSARACSFTITAVATGTGGVASKTDSTSSTISCPDCLTDSTGGTSGGLNSGGGGGAAAANIGEITTTPITRELSENAFVKFNYSSIEHKFSVLNVSATKTTITIESNKQTFTLTLGETIKVDLNSDGLNDMSVKLNSVNLLTKKASFEIAKLDGGSIISNNKETSENNNQNENTVSNNNSNNPLIKTAKGNLWLYLIVSIIVIAIIIILFYLLKKKNNKREN